MKCDMLSPHVKSVLTKAGWSPERKVPIDEWYGYFKAHGLICSAEAAAILENLGGVRISPPRNSDSTFCPEEIVIDPIFAGRADLVKEWQSDLKEPLCPLGSIWNDRAVLVLSGDGKFYGISDLGVHHVGDDLASALEMVISAKILPKLIHSAEDCP